MKKLAILALTLVAPLASYASTSPDAVASIDKTRAGDLPEQVKVFAVKSGELKDCGSDYYKANYVVTQVGSDSMMDEKKFDSTITYKGTYLVQIVCDYGSTYAGAYRETREAILVKAVRRGTTHDGSSPIVTTEADKFSVVRRVDLSVPEEE